ncbi:MauE/DoxX family redox-associated membrane protein [Allorhizocola rhizosphaerae]|uniref:MauE/DoxX family redox-associated membrane protein n=1 Tax=Allorhizocola rhizosphaerae TaxID=1872709 RepID=UPI000E3E1C78|nr:MauE/DoxX family redox-associated membrane protein [Allorhizocola rhizosphaerae]
MNLPIWLTDLVSLAVAVPLLLAGSSKLLSPAPLANGLGEVYRWAVSRPRARIRIARAVAAAELTAAFLVLTGWLGPVGYVLAGGVGLGIAGFAASAIRLGRTVKCGCFGETAGRPLGAGNVVAGFALAAGSVLAFAGSPTGSRHELLLSAASAIALAWVLFKHRSRLAGPFTRHFRSFSGLREGTDING